MSEYRYPSLDHANRLLGKLFEGFEGWLADPYVDMNTLSGEAGRCHLCWACHGSLPYLQITAIPDGTYRAWVLLGDVFEPFTIDTIPKGLIQALRQYVK